MNTCDYENVISYLSYADNKDIKSFLREHIQNIINFTNNSVEFRTLEISITPTALK